jgi:virulence factor Mce-like protein
MRRGGSWSAATHAAPVASAPGLNFGARSFRRPIAGALAVVTIMGVVALSVALFNGRLTETVPVTVITDRTGLLMDRGAKVKLNGAQIGTVAAVNTRDDGLAAVTLAVDPARLELIPDNAQVQIMANTVFGAKSVEFIPPAQPSDTPLRAGQTLHSEHVTVEANTILDDLNSALSQIDPAKLNATLGALSTAFSGRGQALGQTLTDFNEFLGTFEPALPAMSQGLAALPEATGAVADAAPDLMGIVRNASRISRTLVEKQSSLDRFLVSSIGLADTGNDVIGNNEEPLANLMHLLVPTTDLTNEYHEAITCSLQGITKFVLKPPTPVPGVNDLGALTLGIERYRYPQDLPKVAATGGPQCRGQLPLQMNTYPPKVIADVGTNPTRYGNEGILLNSDALKQWLFGPIDGPPRNTVQWGQPG